MELQIEGGSADITGRGIEITPWFSSRPIVIGWSNVMFVSPVPSVKRAGEGWVTFKGEPLTPETLRAGQRFWLLQIALHDRHRVLQDQSFFRKIWLRVSMFLKPLYTAGRTPPTVFSRFISGGAG